MRYYNEARAKICGDTPQLEGHSTVLPGFYLEPGSTEGEWYLHVWLPSGTSSFSHKSIATSLGGVNLILRDYIEDPEEALQKYFAFAPVPRRTPLSRRENSRPTTSADLF